MSRWKYPVGLILACLGMFLGLEFRILRLLGILILVVSNAIIISRYREYDKLYGSEISPLRTSNELSLVIIALIGLGGLVYQEVKDLVL
jgi:hypothetical protein